MRPYSRGVVRVPTEPLVGRERERADLLFAVKVDLEDPTGTLKAGLPVTVRMGHEERGLRNAEARAERP